MTRDLAWFVAMSKPRAEEVARQHLVNQGFDVYLPMCPRIVRRQGRYVTEVSTMFPRYLFVRPFQEEQSISSIRSTVGVQQLVRFGTEFAQASSSLVVDIKAIEAFLLDNPESLPFKAGDEVEITEGPFAGIKATVFACAESRVLLLFQLMGSMRKLGFSPDQCRRV
jgi:transcriptional antiterminator RfaH